MCVVDIADVLEPRPEDTAVSRRGAVLLGASLALGAFAVPREAAAENLTQGGWRYCPRCRGVFRSPKNDQRGSCPAGGKHRPRKDIAFLLYTYAGAAPAGMWHPLAECRKCISLFIISQGSNPISGRCPKGGAHEAGGNPRFVLWGGAPVPIIMDGAWDYCTNCSVIFNWAGGALGVCPAGGGHRRGNNQMSMVVQY